MKQLLNNNVFEKLMERTTIEQDSNTDIVGIESKYNAYFLKAFLYINEDMVDVEELGLKKSNGQIEWFDITTEQMDEIENKLKEVADLVYQNTLSEEQIIDTEAIEWGNTKNALEYLLRTT